MKNKLIRLFRIVDGFLPFLKPLSLLFLPSYWRSLFIFVRGVFYFSSSPRFKFSFFDFQPCLIDISSASGSVPRHYFHQDIWAAKIILDSGVNLHYDCGSRLDGFISHCLVFTSVCMMDIRPLDVKIDNLTFVHTDFSNYNEHIPSSSVQSFSSLHALEHFGLGRYGDSFSHDAYLSAISEIQRIVASGGDIIISVPVGRQRLVYNAHRVFSAATFADHFDKCKLVSFSIVDDSNVFLPFVEMNIADSLDYGAGLFHFRRL